MCISYIYTYIKHVYILYYTYNTYTKTHIGHIDIYPIGSKQYTYKILM